LLVTDSISAVPLLPHIEVAALARIHPIFLISFFFSCSGAHRDLHSFPTRRSSDLRRGGERHAERRRRSDQRPRHRRQPRRRSERSEEHTSELQSPYDLVCRLLLEKKKTTKSTPSLSSRY